MVESNCLVKYFFCLRVDITLKSLFTKWWNNHFPLMRSSKCNISLNRIVLKQGYYSLSNRHHRKMWMFVKNEYRRKDYNPRCYTVLYLVLVGNVLVYDLYFEQETTAICTGHFYRWKNPLTKQINLNYHVKYMFH